MLNLRYRPPPPVTDQPARTSGKRSSMYANRKWCQQYPGPAPRWATHPGEPPPELVPFLNGLADLLVADVLRERPKLNLRSRKRPRLRLRCR